MEKLNKISELITRLFSNEDVTLIKARDLVNIPLNEWQDVNGGVIRYKMVEFAEKYCVSITEWLEDATFNAHYHDDADEVIYTICGEVESDNIKRGAGKKLFFSAGTIHTVKAKKGTLITVIFTYK